MHKVPPSQQVSEATRHVTALDSTTGAEPLFTRNALGHLQLLLKPHEPPTD